MCFDSKRGLTVMFGGGAGYTQFNDTWTWDGASWTQEDDGGPGARVYHRMDYDSARNRVVLFGGMSVTQKQIQVQVRNTGLFSTGYHTETQIVNSSQYFNDTWEYDGTTWTRVEDTGPAPRSSFGFAYSGSVMLLFGGRDGSNVFRDTWQYDGSNWTQRQDIGPAGRAPAGSAYDGLRKRFVIFGGSPGGSGAFGDTWEAFERP